MAELPSEAGDNPSVDQARAADLRPASEVIPEDDADQHRAASVVKRAIRFTDIFAAILLALATVATAWCAYQATRWSGVQATAFAQASSSRVESTRQFNLAIQLLGLDAELFLQWLNAYEAGNEDLASFYETNLIRPDFLPYLQDWIASDPLTNPEALRNPLADEAYRQGLLAESERLRSDAEAKFVEATDANQISDDYVLATVMFASVLFFAGISDQFDRRQIQASLVALGLLMFILGGVQFGSLPIE